MAIYGHLCLLYLGVLTLTISTCVPIMAAVVTPTTLGTGSASYKYEGAANEGGRGQSVWDKYAHEHPEKILDGSNGDVAVDQKCVYPAIYNFGDSNSDTGAGYATTAAVQYPNGISFFGSTSGRCCDGRLIIDFISEELELPYLSSYLNSVGSNYRHGANFAVASAPIRPIIAGLTYLGLQVSQFILFKSHTRILFNEISNSRTEPPLRSGLPRSEDFSKAIYTIDIGQNDISYGLQKPNSSEEEVRRSIPDILSQFSQAVQKLYNEEARVFWIHNTGPIGCIPYYYYFYPHKNEKGNLDANGCVKPHNELAQEYNRQLKDQVFQLRRMFPLAKFTYVDVYTVKYTLISNARSQGLMNPFEFCCGSYQGSDIHYCGKKSIKNGTFYGFACDYPSQYISWDGIHYSQAANEWIAKQILSGSFSDPPVSLGKAC